MNYVYPVCAHMVGVHIKFYMRFTGDCYLDVHSNDAKAQDLYHGSTSIPVWPSHTLYHRWEEIMKS